MPQVTVTINGHPYPVACDPGEEHAHPRAGASSTPRSRASSSNRRARAKRGSWCWRRWFWPTNSARRTTPRSALPALRGASDDDPALADSIDRLARRIEAVAQRLEAAQI